MTPEERIESVIRGFGNFLETCDLDPSEVRDTNELPFPKAEIETAFLAAIALSKNDTNIQDQFGAALIFLAQFQDGVGAALKSPTFSAMPSDPANLSDEELLEVAKRITEESQSQDVDRYNEFLAKVNAESIRLLAKIEEAKSAA